VVVCKNEVKKKTKLLIIVSSNLPHKKNAIQAKDKIKPESAASFRVLSILYVRMNYSEAV